MHHNQEDDRHGEEVKMCGFCQLTKRHGFAEVGVGASVMLGYALWGEIRHAMSPHERKNKSP